MIITFAALFLAVASPQDLPTNQLDQHADIVRQRILIDGTVNRNRDGARTRRNEEARPEISERSREICANKERAAARNGRNHPSVRRLYELCAQAGY